MQICLESNPSDDRRDNDEFALKTFHECVLEQLTKVLISCLVMQGGGHAG